MIDERTKDVKQENKPQKKKTAKRRESGLFQQLVLEGFGLCFALQVEEIAVLRGPRKRLCPHFVVRVGDLIVVVVLVR